MNCIKYFSFAELEFVKDDISHFVNVLKSLSAEFNFDCEQRDLTFFLFIGKHIIFYKHLITQKKNPFLFSIVSDLLYMIYSFLKKEVRYIYLHERSIIESFVRFITSINQQDNHVTSSVLIQFKALTQLSDSDYSLITSEYKTACKYIHGGMFDEYTLASALTDCFNDNDYPRKTRYAHYVRIQKLLQIFDTILITIAPEFVSCSFHRKKSIMEYLIGKKYKDLLFRCLHENKENQLS